MRDALEQFRTAIHRAGLHPPEVIEPDGKLHRFASNGTRGDDAGWYVFHDGTHPAGAFGNWRTGTSETWRAPIRRTLTPAEEAAHRTQSETMRRARTAAEAQRKAKARKQAAVLWTTAIPARADHPYLVRQRVSPVATLREIDGRAATAILGYTPKSRGKSLTGRLLVAPVKIGTTLSTLELIDETGRKSALYGGAKAGGFWAAQPLPEGDGHLLLIGEGVATVLSATEATGHPGIAALSRSNLHAVAKVMRQRYPATRLVILADLGHGEEDARAAAQSVGGVLAVPDFGADPPHGATDFNDLHKAQGLEAVRRAVAAAQAPGSPPPESGSGSRS
ncbi:MAG: toprim domain-containing protein [Acidobacteriaceae bacterium]